MMQRLIAVFWRVVAFLWQLIPSSQRPTRNIRRNIIYKDVVKLFQIPLVMTKVVTSMSEKDLIELRCTCKLWNKIIMSEIHKSHNPQWIISDECAGVVKRLGSLAETMNQSNATGNTVPLIKHLAINAPRATGVGKLFTHAAVLDFFSVCGSYLTRLEINVLSSNSTNSYYRLTFMSGLRHVLFNCTPVLIELSLSWEHATDWKDTEEKLPCRELPCLRKLKLDLGNFVCLGRLQKDLVCAAIQLRSLDVVGAFSPELVLQSFLSNRVSCHLLQELSISFFSSSSGDTLAQMLLQMAQNNGLNLKQFTTHIHLSSERDTRQITAFFSSQANCIKELSLEVWGRFTNEDEDADEGQLFPVQIPQMNTLESLAIILTDTDPHTVHFEGCPVLKSLSLAYTSFAADAWEECLLPLSTSPVHEFKITGCLSGEIETLEMVNILAAYFPCLTRLTIRLCRECLPPVWIAWPSLEFLNLTVSIGEDSMDDGGIAHYLDHDFTGITAENCALLRRRIAAGEIDDYYEEARRMKTSPGITDLKELRQFELTCNTSYGKGVTDVTGYYALAAPDTKLQQISIQLGANFSDMCRAAIQQRLGLAANCQLG